MISFIETEQSSTGVYPLGEKITMYLRNLQDFKSIPRDQYVRYVANGFL